MTKDNLLSSDMLEKVFAETVEEVQQVLSTEPEQIEEDMEEAVESVKLPNPIFKSRYGMDVQGFIAHRPSQQRFYEFPISKPYQVLLTKRLPRKWERVCYSKFGVGDTITINGSIFYPGMGTFYTFEEGKRGNYLVRMDQIDTDVKPSPSEDSELSVIPATEIVKAITI